MKKKQKILYIALVIILIALLIGSSFVSKKEEGGLIQNDATVILDNAQQESSKIKENDMKKPNEINTDDFLSFYSGEESKLVLFARPTCNYCKIAEPIIYSLAKQYDIDINYLNTDDITAEEQENIMNADEFLKENFGTPLLLIVGKNSIIDRVDGLTDTAHYKEFFEKNGYIK